MVLHRGKIATHPEILKVRPLTREDLALILDKRPGLVGVSVVKRFRDPHHRVARLFASGLRIQEVAERSGYSYNRVHTLSVDPAFQELIAKYRQKVDEAFVANVDEFYDMASANMRMAERQIAERLEAAEDEDASPIPLKTLVDISGDRMDRFGYGKRQTNLNVNADFASLLERAIARSGKTIEATALPSNSLTPPKATPPTNSSEESFSSPIETTALPPVASRSRAPQRPIAPSSGEPQQPVYIRRRM